MNVVNGVVVDASVYAFTAQTVTLVFASLGIFSANLFHLQSLTKVAHFSLRARNFSVCRSTQLPGARTCRTAEMVWRGDWADPDLSALRRKSAGRASTSAPIGATVLCELTLPTVPTPPLPEPGEEVVRQS